MFNPDPDRFYVLPQAFNALGRARFPNARTGKELKAHDLPPPDATFRLLKQVKRALEEKRADDKKRKKEEKAKKVEEARRASFRVHSNIGAPRVPVHRPTPAADESEQPSVEDIARCAGVRPYVVEAADDEPAYRREHRARWRRNAVEGDIRRILHDLRPQPVLQNSSDGRRVEIPGRLWFADEFTVEFETGGADWTNIDENGQIAVYQGLVLIEREPFDRAVRGEPVDEDARGEDSRELETAAEEAAQQRPLAKAGSGTTKASTPPEAELAPGEIVARGEDRPEVETCPQPDPAPATEAPQPAPAPQEAANEAPSDDVAPAAIEPASLPKWWPKKPATQQKWRDHYTEYRALKGKNEHWDTTTFAKAIAAKQLGEDHQSQATESLSGTIRKNLGLMIRHGGCPN